MSISFMGQSPGGRLIVKVQQGEYPEEVFEVDIVKDEDPTMAMDRIMNIYWYKVGKNKVNYGS